MNKLLNITIDRNNGTIMFGVELENESSLSNIIVYVDECSNVDNIYEDDEEKHNYIFTQNDCTITKITNKWYIVTISDSSIENLDNHLKYVRISCDEVIIDGIYYNPATIYTAELTHLKKVCSTCLDDACMQMIMYVTFKKQLLDQAISTSDIKNAISLYIDICKLLNLDVAEQCNECYTNCCCIK